MHTYMSSSCAFYDLIWQLIKRTLGIMLFLRFLQKEYCNSRMRSICHVYGEYTVDDSTWCPCFSKFKVGGREYHVQVRFSCASLIGIKDS